MDYVLKKIEETPETVTYVLAKKICVAPATPEAYRQRPLPAVYAYIRGYVLWCKASDTLRFIPENTDPELLSEEQQHLTTIRQAVRSQRTLQEPYPNSLMSGVDGNGTPS